MTIRDIIELSKRDNYENNRKTHPLEMSVSPYFTWMFWKAGASPNQVTLLFLLIAIISAVLFSVNNMYVSFIAYLFYRLHIILDVSDGELARITKKYSIIGKYLDLFTHQFAYPFIYFCIYLHVYLLIGQTRILLAGSLLILLVSFRLSINSIVYRVNYGSKQEIIEKKSNLAASGITKKVALIFSNITGLTQLVELFIICRLLYEISGERKALQFYVAYALISQITHIIIKIFLVLRTNMIPRRDSLY